MPADAKAWATRAPVMPPPTIATVVSCGPDNTGYRRFRSRDVGEPQRSARALPSL